MDPAAKKLEKEKKLQEKKELALLFKPVQSQTIPKGYYYQLFICFETIIIKT